MNLVVEQTFSRPEVLRSSSNFCSYKKNKRFLKKKTGLGRKIRPADKDERETMQMNGIGRETRAIEKRIGNYFHPANEVYFAAPRYFLSFFHLVERAPGRERDHDLEIARDRSLTRRFSFSRKLFARVDTEAANHSNG